MKKLRKGQVVWAPIFEISMLSAGIFMEYVSDAKHGANAVVKVKFGHIRRVSYPASFLACLYRNEVYTRKDNAMRGCRRYNESCGIE